MEFIGSPYANSPASAWPEITLALVQRHPLGHDEIRDIALSAWQAVWSTRIGTDLNHLPLRDVLPPATVIGYFFEKLFAHELARRYPNMWRGSMSAAEKDIHCIPDPRFSIEVKTSGQLGLKVYGNRSYNQELANGGTSKKDKSGYYLIVNFYGEILNLIRFGWIDGSDWQPQKSATGQMAGLPEEVYANKLIPIRGEYTLFAPVGILDYMGPVAVAAATALRIFTVGDLLNYNGTLPSRLLRARAAALGYASEYSS
ncbi:TPA: ScaI family restriction endonuclease [Burkholderia cepacia ATCC 25416]|uniref:ScaI family restriction endonuclease n=1 Tax=Burkholderia cepacia TaxID=292 RepID=UPI001CF4DC69|nr:ScaI family restriction endonuclease [Burkholderia cepacia]HDR9766572.1 ScaI family restriction endonuclease [Burkholderia cepacia ATCC 25416]MCA8080742.1 ScaI family restriction endonuclease [Burkholderia cepacia]MCA8321170.1 ScaI family restriction endonuclease [Burkholderia cepacia]HDR9778220.1 ScaI family restriction endonuclease [Burkholderia cepacia ATCC 25416]HDR9785851.1 ScaI family restriction endonuclease [Burkholderia cepacia ATCC 25416]